MVASYSKLTVETGSKSTAVPHLREEQSAAAPISTTRGPYKFGGKTNKAKALIADLPRNDGSQPEPDNTLPRLHAPPYGIDLARLNEKIPQPLT